MPLTILYRGSLSSCNYACDYCPFAKHKDSRTQLAKDKTDLERFISWVAQQKREISILFTPWGEALIRGYYRDAIATLSNIPHVKKVAIQTNFSCSVQWLRHCDLKKTAFWVTYHPTEISLKKFIEKCKQLDEHGTRYSVGSVGIKENFAAIEQCREQLAPHIYLWINAYKREQAYYTEQEIHQLLSIDPHFGINNQYHSSLNKICNTGESVISVNGNGDGDVTRCHFIKHVIANIYDENFEQYLKPRLCSNKTCGCYIGYIHMPYLNQANVYEDGLLERIAAWGV